jgi:alpha-tubulin suppressor-like RCC1 family protein
MSATHVSRLLLASTFVFGGCAAGEDPMAATESSAVTSGGVREASLSWANTCVVTRAGAAKCWGSNYDGQLGNGGHQDSFRAVDVTGLGADVAKVSLGGSYACALTVHGAVKCWGANAMGQLGNGNTVAQTAPVDVIGLGSGITSLATGADHACALTNDGKVKCWGANDLGQLGDGTTTASTVPVNVHGFTSRVSKLATSGSHTCALMTSGGVKCWGSGSRGQLGNGSTTDSPLPVDVAGLGSGVKEISVGLEHTCAVTDRDGFVHCWGRNDFGQLGNGNQTDASRPGPVRGMGGPVALLASGGYHNCVVTNRGGAVCWGLASAGQLGDGHDAFASGPVDVHGMDARVTGISLGLYHSCATTEAGTLSCWGFNGTAGALGIEGSTEKSTVPVTILP